MIDAEIAFERAGMSGQESSEFFFDACEQKDDHTEGRVAHSMFRQMARDLQCFPRGAGRYRIRGGVRGDAI